MKAEIVAVGTELLMGETADTNSGWLASRFPQVGLELQYVTVVGDNLAQLTEVLGRAFQRSDFTFTCGGLGPTEDDLTRDAVAKVLGEEITTAPELLRWLEGVFRERRMEMPAANIKQAGIIPSATSLPNPMGTAPAWWVERGGHVIVTMPGPPRELQFMWEHQVEPRIRERVRGNIVLTRTFKTIGLSEAAVDEMVHHLYGSNSNPYLGIYAKPDGIYLRAIARAQGQRQAQEMLHPLEEGIQGALGRYIWGVDEDRPEEMVGRLLTERGLTLATIESCTGGLLAGTITDVPGSSRYFRGGIIAYSNDIKVAAGVDPTVIEKHGAVSQECAAAMAQAVCRHLGADCGLSVTGVAGPDSLEGVAPGNVFIGVAHPGGVEVLHQRYPPRRPLVKARAATMALLELVRVLKAGVGQK
ncbi:MAG: competence/damage-inducible protein A [Chloroflexi bacterium]|nr:competence/damage-inducible protein A [Chloroflexota bacterium]